MCCVVIVLEFTQFLCIAAVQSVKSTDAIGRASTYSKNAQRSAQGRFESVVDVLPLESSTTPNRVPFPTGRVSWLI